MICLCVFRVDVLKVEGGSRLLRSTSLRRPGEQSLISLQARRLLVEPANLSQGEEPSLERDRTPNSHLPKRRCLLIRLSRAR